LAAEKTSFARPDFREAARTAQSQKNLIRVVLLRGADLLRKKLGPGRGKQDQGTFTHRRRRPWAATPHIAAGVGGANRGHCGSRSPNMKPEEPTSARVRVSPMDVHVPGDLQPWGACSNGGPATWRLLERASAPGDGGGARGGRVSATRVTSARAEMGMAAGGRERRRRPCSGDGGHRRRVAPPALARCRCLGGELPVAPWVAHRGGEARDVERPPASTPRARWEHGRFVPRGSGVVRFWPVTGGHRWRAPTRRPVTTNGGRGPNSIGDVSGCGRAIFLFFFAATCARSSPSNTLALRAHAKNEEREPRPRPAWALSTGIV